MVIKIGKVFNTDVSFGDGKELCKYANRYERVLNIGYPAIYSECTVNRNS